MGCQLCEDKRAFQSFHPDAHCEGVGIRELPWCSLVLNTLKGFRDNPSPFPWVDWAVGFSLVYLIKSLCNEEESCEGIELSEMIGSFH